MNDKAIGKERLMELARAGARAEVTRLVDAFGVGLLEGIQTARPATSPIAGEVAPSARPEKRPHWSKLPGNEKKAASWRRKMRAARRA